jgi:hypothetical protein
MSVYIVPLSAVVRSSGMQTRTSYERSQYVGRSKSRRTCRAYTYASASDQLELYVRVGSNAPRRKTDPNVARGDIWLGILNLA